MGGGDKPDAPDPIATATGQARANINTAVANSTIGNADVYSPLGQSTFKEIGSTSITLPDGSTASVPRYQNDVKLSPGQQTLFDNGLRNQTAQSEIQGDLMSGVRQAISHPVTAPTFWTGYDTGGDIQKSVPVQMAQTSLGDTDFTADRDATTKAILDRLQPQMDNSDAALAASLANQGIAQGSAAWNAAMQSQAGSKNDLRLGAVQAGNAEQQQLFQQKLAAGQFGQQGVAQNNAAQLAAGGFANQAQAQQNSQNRELSSYSNQGMQAQFQADLASQNQDLNMMSALQSGSQVSMPQFSGFQGGTVAQTPYADSVYKSAQLDQQSWQTEQQQNAAMMQGLFGLAGSMGGLFKMSDRRLKRQVRRLGTTRNGLALYSWRYSHDASRLEVGFMADEVARVRPEAVARHPSGFLMVDMERAAA